MTRTELNEQMTNGGKTGLLIASETGRELLQARIEELEELLAINAKLAVDQATLIRGLQSLLEIAWAANEELRAANQTLWVAVTVEE